MSLEFKIDIFDPRKESLHEIVESVKDITADPKKITKDELTLVSDTRKMLGKHRTKIKEAGLAARNDANAYNKKVIAYEKDLIDIIEPEEKRLKGIEDAMKEHNIREVRREKLPEFKERLMAIGDSILVHAVSDDFILKMDPNEFEVYYNERVANHNERKKVEQEEKHLAEQAKIDEDKKKIEDEKNKLQHDKDIEKAKKETEARVKKEAKEEEVRVAKEEKANKDFDEVDTEPET